MNKRSYLFIFIIVCISFLTSCSNRRKSCRTVVEDVTDSTITISCDGKAVVLNMIEAKLTNGAVMQGDSVIVEYIGTGKKAKALLVELIPQLGTIVSLEELQQSQDKELITIPKEEQ